MHPRHFNLSSSLRIRILHHPPSCGDAKNVNVLGLETERSGSETCRLSYLRVGQSCGSFILNTYRYSDAAFPRNLGPDPKSEAQNAAFCKNYVKFSQTFVSYLTTLICVKKLVFISREKL
jgi:hypothetical protein